jgi:hypothetical protein
MGKNATPVLIEVRLKRILIKGHDKNNRTSSIYIVWSVLNVRDVSETGSIPVYSLPLHWYTEIRKYNYMGHNAV